MALGISGYRRIVTFATHVRMLLVALALCLAIPASASAADPQERVVVKGPVVVERGDTAGDVVVIDGDVLVRGKVDGNLVVVNGDVTLRGTVTGDLVTVRKRAVFGSRGRVEGDVRYGDKKPQGAEGKVGGKIDKLGLSTTGGIGLVIGVWLAFSVSALLLGLLLILLAPRGADAVARAGRGKPLMSFLVGLLAFFLLPLLGLVLLVTVIGIPLGVGLLLAVVPLYGIAYVSSAWILGRRILNDKPRILAFLVGLVILRLLALIPIAGGIVWFLATVYGLGALFVAMRTPPATDGSGRATLRGSPS